MSMVGACTGVKFGHVGGCNVFHIGQPPGSVAVDPRADVAGADERAIFWHSLEIEIRRLRDSAMKGISPFRSFLLNLHLFEALERRLKLLLAHADGEITACAFQHAAQDIGLAA